MSLFKHHVLMSRETVKTYVLTKTNIFAPDAILEVTEIGDGNINYVFLVKEEKTGKSVVVKQADTLLRSSGRPLDINRSRIEADILRIQYELVPEFVPEVYHYDDTMAALIMEDISAYQNLRYELEKKRMFPHLAKDISVFLVETLLSTTDLIWDRHDKKRKVAHFVNVEMCDISEDLVFTEPYNNYKQRNVILEENQAFVDKNIYGNQVLLKEVGVLRNNYMNNAQSLIHGDLHSGSIFINDKGLKVIDPEFAFYGPMGYDIGNVLAHLMFPLAKNDYFETDSSFKEGLEETISSLYELVKDGLKQKMAVAITLELYNNEAFINEYVEKVMTDTLGYLGTEVIRRVIGDSKVKEISQSPVGDKRLEMERVLLRLGIDLVTHRQNYQSGQDILKGYEQAKQKERGVTSEASR